MPGLFGRLTPARSNRLHNAPQGILENIFVVVVF